jgi:tetratricopeptide (TPR) repeat protein
MTDIGSPIAAVTMQVAEALFRDGRMSQARAYYERAAEQGERSALVYVRLALIANEERRVEDALNFACQAVEAEPEDPDHRYLLGRLHKAQGAFARAEAAYREALRLRPSYVDAWVSLGILLRLLQRPAEAEECHREALRLAPRNLVARLNLGNALLAQGRVREAAECFQEAVELDPKSAPAHRHLANAFLEQGHLGAAIPHFATALDIDPRDYEAAMGLARAFQWNSAFEDASSAFRLAIEIKPNDRFARLGLANLHFLTHDSAKAIEECERLLREFPDWSGAQTCLANVLGHEGEITRSKELYERALAAEPADHAARANYALLLLRLREFERAWEYYESRWPGILTGLAYQRGFAQPRWSGELLRGKALLITAEQGLGDEILFASVIPEVLRAAAHCVIECDRRLAPLFLRSFSGATVVGVDRKQDRWPQELADQLEQLPPFDYWTPIGSLPRHFRRSVDDFPSRGGYLHADPERVAYWRNRLAALGPGRKIGLSWRGGSKRTRGTMRSLSLEQLAPLLATPGVDWISLQYGPSSEERATLRATTGLAVHHWEEAIDAYDETAALVASLDLVISVCTAVVNLCGALGQPVWVLTPLVPDFRYGCQGPDIVWYPGARAFRQRRLGDWAPVLTEVGAALEDFVAKKA